MTHVTVRYDLRLPPFAGGTATDRYRACLAQCAFADGKGVQSATFSEHHGAGDGFLPSPLLMASAVGARTERLVVMVQALLLPFHHPLRLAEDLAIASLVCGGRLAVVAGLGYREEEFEAFGIDRKERGRMTEDILAVLQLAWTGEEFEFEGRRARVTPKPDSPPILFVGGSGEVSARRAARLHLPFLPAVADVHLQEVYEAACVEEGFTGWCILPSGPGFVHVTDDPERDWDRLAPSILHDARTYASWQRPDQRSHVHTDAVDLEGIRASGVYEVVTPDECVALATALGDHGAIVLHPLMGGMDIDLGWESLQLFADQVLPRLQLS